MKETIRREDELPVTLSPHTKDGQIVFSKIKVLTDPSKPGERLVEETLPEASDAIKVLQFLNMMNGIGWTPELKRIEKELRIALHDLMTLK